MIRHIDWLGREVKPQPKRRKVKRKPLGDGVYVLCVAIAILAGAFMYGCASAGPSIPLDLQRAELCMRQGPCFVIRTENQLFERAVIYVNGARIDEVEGLSGHPIWVRESVLKEGRCAYVTAVLKPSELTLLSGRQCIAVGGYFTLRIALGNHLWLDQQLPQRGQ